MFDLSQIVSGALLPAAAVVTLFWKGDDALSGELKEVLSGKIKGTVSAAAEASSLKPLASIFDLLYGQSALALSTFARIAAVSTIAFLIVLAAFDLKDGHLPLSTASQYFTKSGTLLILGNILFDVFSVTKARYIIGICLRHPKDYPLAVFFVLDIVGTIAVLFLYAFWIRLIDPTDPDDQWRFLWFLGAIPFIYAILTTSFLTTILTTIYLLSLTSLRWAGLTKALAGLLWALPVKEKPVRSIGVVAGGLLFGGVFLASLFAGVLS
jgi:hypothetical protein